MKRFVKLIATLLLVISLIFNAVSCDLLLPFIEDSLGGEQSGVKPDGGSTEEDNDNDSEGDEEKEAEFYIKGDSSYDLTVGDMKALSVKRSAWLEGEIIWVTSNSCVAVENGVIIAREEGAAVITAILGDLSSSVVVTVSAKEDVKPEIPEEDDGRSETIIVPGTQDPVTEDPYVNVDKDEFYANYTPAISYNDAQYRTEHGLMSGSIDAQDQAPTISEYQPMKNGKYVRNNVYIFSEDGNTYYVVDCYGEVAFAVYRGGAYVVLEEVAAYVFAFGEPPANQSESKKANPKQSIWGQYLRVNHSQFSGDTSRYPYEPELPRISGCGGDFIYYEMDIGTTGTDCDPGYEIKVYNDGYTITRGAARIVYTYQDKNSNGEISLDERYVFYTYNHYNDFQEYLNYEGGWGEMFGNITGGGQLSSKTNCNPTDYVYTTHAKIKSKATAFVVYYYIPKNEFAA